MTSTKPLVNWIAITRVITKTAPLFTKTGFVKVSLFAEWLSDNPKLSCPDLKDIPMRTMRYRLSMAMRDHLHWERRAKGNGGGPVYAMPEKKRRW